MPGTVSGGMGGKDIALERGKEKLGAELGWGIYITGRLGGIQTGFCLQQEYHEDPLTEGGPLGLCAGDMSSTCHRNNKRAHGKYSAMNSNRECFSGGFFGEEDDNFGRG